MWGLIIGIALGGLLLLTAVTAWREGELALGEQRFRRGELSYTLAVGAMGLVGLGSLGGALWMAVQVEETEPIAMDFGPFAMSLPGDWSPSEELPKGMSSDDVGIAAFAGPGGDLMLTWRRAPAAEASALDELVEGLKQPDLAYSRWEDRAVDGRRVVDMEYPAPRGTVRGRAIASVDGSTLWWIVASCSHDGAPARCERTIASLHQR